MFTQNVGTADRFVRITVGIIILILFALNPFDSYRWVFLIGIVPLLTGVFGTCALYSLVGKNTCRLK